MKIAQAYEILREIVSSLLAKGEKVPVLPSDFDPDRTLEEAGIDLMAFSDILEEFSNRFNGKDFHLDSFTVPHEYFYLTFGKFLESISNSFRLPTKTPIVVYVDDEEENLFVFKRRLGKHLNLKTFTSPLDALEFIKTNSDVCLVITDEVMPKLSGNELCDEVKKAKPNMKFILITGNPNSDEDLMYKSLRHSRFYEFLNKPLDFDRKGDYYLKTIQSLAGIENDDAKST